MKNFKNSIVLMLVAGVLLSGLLYAERGSVKGTEKDRGLQKPTIAATGSFDGNRIDDDLENNGMIVSQNISGRSGMSWPAGNNTQTVYASGIWVGGLIGNIPHVSAGEYAGEFVGGPWGSSPGDPQHTIYKVNKSDIANPLAHDDFQNWPVEFGAPWVDENGNGIYEPLPNGPDHPEFIGDQVVWMVMNDGDPTQHSVFQTNPLGLEMQSTIFGFDRPDAFGDMMFVKVLLINKGEEDIIDTYIGLWSDPDLGDAADDFVGCDTTLGLGICYNDGVDNDFAGYSGGTPAVGYDFFQGPIVPAPGETALVSGRVIQDYKNLKMTSFSKYINTTDPVWSDPNSAKEAYNLMKGLMKSGVPYADRLTGGSMYVHPGDPTKDVGPGDTEYVDSDIHASGDRRFLMNAGPFTMAVGDSQEVVFGIINAAAGSALDSYNYLKEVDISAQLAYDIQFALPPAPPQPEVSYTVQANEINLSWDTAAESYYIVDELDKMPVLTDEVDRVKTISKISIDSTFIYGHSVDDTLAVYDPDSVYANPVIILGVVHDTTYSIESVNVYKYSNENTSFEFEGYNVYQFETISGSGVRKLITTFDVVNGVEDVQDVVFDPKLGENVLITVQNGTDSGLEHNLTITGDAIQDGIPLKTNRVYYFGVVAYGYNPYGIPKTLESSPVIHAIRPAVPVVLDVEADGAEDLSEDVDHSAGLSDGNVTVAVINPHEVTGHDYKVTFRDQPYYKGSDGEWHEGTPSAGKALGKTLDLTGTTVSAVANIALNSIGFVFTVNLKSPDYDYADGVKLTFPAGITINSAETYSPCDDGSSAVPVIDHTNNTVMWGNHAVTEWGCFAGGEQLYVNTSVFAPPIDIYYTVYDDGWAVGYGEPYASLGNGVVDAEGVVTIDVINYETRTVQVWDVTDLKTGSKVSQTNLVTAGIETAVNNFTGEKYTLTDDASWVFFDGIKVQVSGAPPHTLAIVSWFEDGEISPVFGTVEEYTDVNGNGIFDPDEPYDDFGLDGFEDYSELGYVSLDDELIDPIGDDYDAKVNPLGSEGNGVWNPYPTPEPYTDGNSNGKYDVGESFDDYGVDGLASVDEGGYLPRNLDPNGDNYWNLKKTEVVNPLGTEGNEKYDVGEVYEDANGDGTYTTSEPYTDGNGNGAYDAGYSTEEADAEWRAMDGEDYEGDGWLAYSTLDNFQTWWGGGSSIGGAEYATVEVRFVPMQSFTDVSGNGLYSNGEPYTWDTADPNAGYADMYLTWGGAYLGRHPVPYTAWNMDTSPPTQLAIVQRDRDDNGRWDGVRSGNYNYIWVTNIPYGTETWDDADGENDFMWMLDNTAVPVYYTVDLDIDPSVMLAKGSTLTLTPAKDNVATDEFVFSTKGANSKEYDPDNINVWPNPYFGFNPEERDPIEQIVQFTNLPETGNCTIRIFNIAGVPVRTINHTDGTQFEKWDLKNNFRIPVASGMYIVVVETDKGDKLLKLAIIQPEQRLDVY